MNNLVLSESTPINDIVYTLEGYDPEGGNVTFGLIGSDNFAVDPTSGQVRVIKSLDREVCVNNVIILVLWGVEHIVEMITTTLPLWS